MKNPAADDALSKTAPPRDRLAAARLCVLVSGGADVASFERLVGSLVEAGIPMLQLRDKQLPDEALLDRCRSALALARQLAPARPPLVIVNDRVEVAVAAAADGVHLGASDMPVSEARRRLGPTALIGRTAHSLPEAEAGLAAGADYLGVGPCFPSATKSFSRHASPGFLAAAAKLPLPVFAIGGIDSGRVGELTGLGINRVAVAAAVTAAAEPAESARAILDALRR